MALSNIAVPKYYGRFRDAVFNGEKWVDSILTLEDKRGRK